MKQGSNHRPFLILLDGPMGAGKTTIAKILHGKMKRTAHLGLDRIKWFISDFKRVPKDNEIVRNVILAMAKEYLRQGIGVILEQGMKKELVEKLKRMARAQGARCLVYQLDAPKPLLFERVKRRPQKPGKPKVSNARVERNYQIHLKNKYRKAIILDTKKLSARQIADRITKDLMKFW